MTTSEARLLPNAALISPTSARVDWATAFTVEDTRLDYAEARFVTMAPINNRPCVFAWCQRGEALRVISLRKANKRERNKYEKAIHQP
jgi:uncharacterized DUF497 family protein